MACAIKKVKPVRIARAIAAFAKGKKSAETISAATQNPAVPVQAIADPAAKMIAIIKGTTIATALRTARIPIAKEI